jgi:hypothetical protein
MVHDHAARRNTTQLWARFKLRLIHQSPGLGRRLGLPNTSSQALGRLKPAQRPGLARPERAWYPRLWASRPEPAHHYSSSSRGDVYAPVPNSQFYSDVKRPLPAGADEGAVGPSATPWRLQAGGLKSAHQPSQSLSTFSSPATASTDATESEVILRHEDSGVRIPMETRPGVTVVEMPPMYSAA